MKSLNQIIAELEDFATAHWQIHTFGHGDVWEISPQSSDIVYPVLWMVPQTATPTLNEVVDEFTVLCMDLVDSGERNETEVLSDTRQIILDVCAYYRQTHTNSYIIEFGGSIQPFTERDPERVSGHSLTIRIKQPHDYNLCAVPANAVPAPPIPSCADATVQNAASNPTYQSSVASGGVLVLPQLKVLDSDGVTPILANYIPNTSGFAVTCTPPTCADATVTVNTAPFGTAPSGGALNVPVVSEDLTNAGTIVAGKVVIANTDVTINTVAVDSLQAEDTYALTVTLDGAPTTPTYNSGTKTIAVFNVAPTFDPDTTNLMTAVGVAADSTVYYAGTQYEITGLGMWQAADFLITAMKDLDIYSVTWNGYTMAKEVIVAIYPYIGGTAARHRFNAGDPQALSASKYLTFNGSFTHDGGGVQGLGNGWAETNMLISDFGGLGGGMCYNRSYSLGNAYDFGTLKSGGTSFAHQSRNNNSQTAFAMDASAFGDTRFVQDSRGFSGFMRNTNAQAYWLGRQLVASFATAAGVGVNTNTIVLHAARNFAGTPTQFRPDQYGGFLFTKYVTPSKLTDLSIVWENYNGRLYRAAV